MEDQKLENLLNLALGATEEEREKSLNLDVGYHPIDREWELIIKYSGNLFRHQCRMQRFCVCLQYCAGLHSSRNVSEHSGDRK